MPVTNVSSDPTTLALTIVADYPVSVDRRWEAYADPRQLKRFWGPVEWPATYTRHDMAVGGESHYYMTGPDGPRAGGWFRFLAIEPRRRIELEDGFANDNGRMNSDMPTMRMVFTFEATKTGSRFTSVTQFPHAAAMEQVLQMGMMEPKLLNDTQVRVSRVIRGTVAQVWRAHHDATLMRRWFLGPDGWTMPVCEIATAVGGRHRHEWENTANGQSKRPANRPRGHIA